MIIRPTKAEDLPTLQHVLAETQLFPPDMLPDMIAPFLGGTASDELWLTAEVDGQAAGLCYAAAEPMTEGTWNMRAIAVHPACQGTGIGTGLTDHLEQSLRRTEQRLLIVDTSGLDDFRQTRAFYRRNGYTEEARIRDFWAAGDDKIVFRKALH